MDSVLLLLVEVDVLLARPGVEQLRQPLVVHAAVHKLILIQGPIIIHIQLLKHSIGSLNSSLLHIRHRLIQCNVTRF